MNEDEIVKQLSRGLNHSYALTNQGRIYVWGENDYGQLGDGTFIEKNSPMLLDVFIETYVVNEEIYDYNEMINVYTPTREGYNYDGWYENRSFTDSFDFQTMSARELYTRMGTVSDSGSYQGMAYFEYNGDILKDFPNVK